MWEIGNRGVVGLLSVLVGSVILYNAWGLIFVLAILLFLVVNTCYSLLVNDSLVSRHNLLVFQFVREVVLDLSGIVEQISALFSLYVRELVNAGKRYYRQRFNSNLSSNMNRPRRSSYHLSSDSFVKPRDSSYSNTNLHQLSPIPKERYQHIDDWSERTRFVENNEFLEKCTSTPLLPWRKENVPNGEPQHVSSQSSSSKISPLQSRNHTLSRGEETFFSPEGSPWGTSISPKMRAKAAGVKTVQTVAGPLLASTRYNIDTKVYTDVTSPGLTTRLSKYASEMNNKLLQQPQYGMGHFPKVNLNASPTPLINTKAAKMRMPVTVRIAQPETVRCSYSDRHKLLNMARHSESQSPPNVVQALREISLKRHASREDVTSDLVKKQRTDGIYSENLEEITQKRSREISPSLSPPRPSKRTKSQSCNDILNSLSSSIHVFSGVKRKATDISRSSTPDFEKHFKSLEKYPSENFTVTPQGNEALTVVERYVSDPLPAANVTVDSEQNSRKELTPKENFTSSAEEARSEKQKSPERWEIKRPQVLQKVKSLASPVKLSDKLFMREEPQSNDKLRNIIEEQSNVKDKFSMEDKDQIKKKDIVNMRQTSMRARLQNMFDAISGKGANKINPDVVIQAEAVNDQISTPTSTPLTTLSSTTTTTNVNTSPITSPIVPILKSSLTKKSPKKHVTFNLPSGGEATIDNAPAPVPKMNLNKPSPPKHVTFNLPSSGEPTTATTVPTLAAEGISSNKEEAKKPEGFSVGVASSGNTTASTFTFGKNASNSSTATVSGSGFTTITADASKDKILSSSSNFEIAKPVATPVITSIFSLKNAPQDVKNNLSADSQKLDNPSQNENNPQILNATQAVTNTMPSAFTFGGAAKSSAVPAFGQSSTAENQKSQPQLPSSTFSSNFNPTAATSAMPTTPAFSFGASKPSIENTTQPFASATPGFSFSTNTAPTSNISNLNKVETASSEPNSAKTPAFTFGSTTAAKPGFSFGATTTTSSAPVFGASNPTSTLNTTIATNPSSSIFGASNPTAVTNPSTTSVPSFGMSAKASPSFTSPSNFGAGNTPSLGFGASNTNEVKQFGAPTTTASLFGTATTSTTSISFKPSNSQPIFGNSTSGAPSAFGTPKTTASLFVSNSSTPSFGATTTNAPSLFTNTNSTTGAALPTFGASTTSNLFSQGNTSTEPAPPAFGASTTSSSLFNNVNTTTTSNPILGSNSNIFNQSKPPAFGATSSNFGNTSSSLFATSSSSSSGFTATNPGTSATPAFGSSNPAPLFGTQTSGTAPVSQNSGFGFSSTTSNAPGFGATATTTGFGANTNSNFQTQNNAGATFGAGSSNPPTFGGTSTFASQTGSVFGTSTPGPAFGTAVNNNTGNNNAASASGAFTFGANQNQTQSTSAFTFGASTNNTNNTSNNNSAAPFQFGSTAAKPATTGFNFTTASTTPSINFGGSATTFNAPAPGTNNFSATGNMFSIGTGSTAPRSRPARSRRQR